MEPTVLDFLRAMLPGMALFAALWSALRPLRRRRLARLGLVSPSSREWLLLAFVAYCGGMAVLTLLPNRFDLLTVLRKGYNEPFFRRGTVNLHLMQTLRYGLMIFAANVIMSIPFGFFPAVLWRRSRWWKAMIIAVGTTCFIECWQIHIGRSFDVDDLLLNAAGAMLGWLLWLILKKPTRTCEER